MYRKITLQLWLMIVAMPLAFPQSGTLVPTFGDKGIVLIDFDQTGAADDFVSSIRMDSEGRTIISGGTFFNFYPYTDSHGTSEIVCLNSDNSPDSTFDGDGKLILPNFRIDNTFITSNDKILLVEKPQSNGYGIIKQLNSDGSPDITYGTNGELLVNDFIFSESFLDQNGKLFLAGNNWIGDTSYYAVIRINANGSFDNSFGTYGKILIPILYGQNFNFRLMNITDKLLFAGSIQSIHQMDDFYIMRLNMDGSIDSTFNKNGTLIFQDSNYDDEAEIAAVDFNGSIVIVGGSSENSFSKKFISVVRLKSDGRIDSTFHSTGKLVIPEIWENFPLLLFDNNHKIILGVHSDFDPMDMVRINDNGSIDTSFGVHGEVSALNMNDFTLQPDNKILLAGSTESVNNISSKDFKIIRLESDGASDLTFGDSGELIIPVANGADKVLSMALDAKGKIILAGYSVIEGNNQESSIARINPDGRLDSTFGSNGKKILKGSAFNDNVNNVAIDSHGRILTESNVSNNEIGPLNGYINRFNDDGNADTSFKAAEELNFQYCHFYSIYPCNLTDKVLLAYSYRSLFDSSYYAIIRLNYNGSIDSSFGTDGKIIFSQILDFSSGTIVIDTQDRILVVGSIYLSDHSKQQEIVRLSPDGIPDSTFNNYGKQIYNIDLSLNTSDIAIDKNNKFLLSGFSDQEFDHPLTLSRINPDGSIDSAFGHKGILVQTAFHLGRDGDPSLSIYSGNKIFLAYSYSDSLGPGFDIESLNLDGSPDTTFGHLGKINVSKGYVTSMTADSNYIWMAGNDEGDYKIVKLYARNNQYIDFTLPDTVIYDDLLIKLNGTATSGLPVTYMTNNPAIAYTTHDTLKIMGPGAITITAVQTGNGSFYAAAPVNKNLLIQSNISSVISHEPDNPIRAYPNPISNILYLESPVKIKSVTLSSVEGILIFSKTNISERDYKIDMSRYTPGCYILTIQTDDENPVRVLKVFKYQ